MPTTAAEPQAVAFVIPPAHRQVAAGYIAAIVRRERLALISGAFAEARSRELHGQFEAAYASLNVGPYARHGSDALRIALGRL